MRAITAAVAALEVLGVMARAAVSALVIRVDRYDDRTLASAAAPDLLMRPRDVVRREFEYVRHGTQTVDQRWASTLISAVTRWMFTFPLGPDLR